MPIDVLKDIRKPWNRGMKMSEEHRKKLSIAHLIRVPAEKVLEFLDAHDFSEQIGVPSAPR
jgi:predicted DNA-binding protein (UPF0278 family)